MYVISKVGTIDKRLMICFLYLKLKYVITNIKKYATAGKTIAEIFATDETWLRWVAKNYTPRGEKAVEDVEAIKKFLETK